MGTLKTIDGAIENAPCASHPQVQRPTDFITILKICSRNVLCLPPEAQTPDELWRDLKTI